MDYSFNVELAKKYGVEEAVFLNHLLYWTQHNEANGRNFHDGRYWTYNSAQAFTAIFPFWSRKKIDRIIQALTDSCAVYIGNFNTDGRDRTRWFALDESVICIGQIRPMDCPKTSNALPESDQPLPDNNSNNKPNIKRNTIFIAPTIQEVKDYAASMHLDIDPAKFMSYYTASDWHDSQGKKVRNWKQKAITWSGRGKKPEKKSAPTDADYEHSSSGYEIL